MPTPAAVFPGQGAQLVGMGKDVADAFPEAAATFAQADDLLGYKLSELCFNGPADRLNATDIQQPAIFTTSVAIFRAAVAAGRFAPDGFAAMAGLSLGEYTALHLAGALPFEDALQLVQRRGQLMQQAAEQSQGGMVSIMGLDEDKVRELCERVSSHGRVGPANFNCRGQIVISGDQSACEAACARVEDFGGKAIPLKVAGAFHSVLMQPAADALCEPLDKADFATPNCRVVANVDAEYHQGPDTIRVALCRQVTHPVRWQMCIERLIADGCDQFWEVGPNRVLTGLMRKIDRSVDMTNISTVADLSPGK
ncbi:MAG: ACP S-malonyltransferase [Phycisphaerae bacterium]|nr:ACP S-malonyltransferase [Phycisphaerae bacterium]